MWEHILSAVGGGLEGGVKGYKLGKDIELEEKKLAQREEIERFKDETRRMLAEWAETGKFTRHVTPSGDTVVKEQGADGRHDRVSGNVAATQAGLDRRHTTESADQQARTAFLYDQLFVNDALDRYTHDNPSGNARLGAETAVRGQDVTAATTRRGQDITAATTRRGQDIGAETTRRGQDFTFNLGTAAETGRNTRAAAAEAGRNSRARMSSWSLDPEEDQQEPEPSLPAEAQVPAAPPVAAPPARAPIPLTPRPAAPSGGPGGAPPVAAPGAAPAPMAFQQLETTARAKLAEFQREQDPAKKAALQAELLRLRQQILDARAK